MIAEAAGAAVQRVNREDTKGAKSFLGFEPKKFFC